MSELVFYLFIFCVSFLNVVQHDLFNSVTSMFYCFSFFCTEPKFDEAAK